MRIIKAIIKVIEFIPNINQPYFVEKQWDKGKPWKPLDKYGRGY
jgi:hypothetical protein